MKDREIIGWSLRSTYAGGDHKFEPIYLDDFVTYTFEEETEITKEMTKYVWDEIQKHIVNNYHINEDGRKY